MKRRDPSVDSALELIDEQAAEWVIRLSGDESDATLKAFERWREEDPRHAERFEAQSATWQSLDDFRLPLLTHFDGMESSEGDGMKADKASRFRWKVPLGIAAVAVLSVLCWGTLNLWNSYRDLTFTQEFVAENLDFQRFKDGSFVELNRGTKGQASFSHKERRVTLLSGEAHFEVAKDRTRPFVVEAGNARIEAVGTAFNVQVRDGEVDVVVSEGVVRVTRLSTDAESRSETVAPNPVTTELRATQRAVVTDDVSEGTETVETLSPSELAKLLSWKVVEFDFEATPLREVIKEFNRVNRLQFVLKGDVLGDLEIDGRFSSDNREGFVRMLQLTANVEIERDPSGEIVILPSSR